MFLLGGFKRNLAIGIIAIIIGVLLSEAVDALHVVPPQYLQYMHIALIVIFGIIVIEIVAHGIRIAGKHFIAEEGNMIADLFRVVAYSVIAISVLYAFKINVTGLLIGAGFLGIVVGLAAQNTLGNILAGLEIIAARPFRLGERVTITTWQYSNMPPTFPHELIIPGFTGVVEKIGVVYSYLLSEDGSKVYIPNSILLQAAILNHNRSEYVAFKQRVELPIAKDFASFKKAFMKEFASHAGKGKAAVRNLSIGIADINNGYYGVNISAEAGTTSLDHSKEMVKEAALSAIEKMK